MSGRRPRTCPRENRDATFSPWLSAGTVGYMSAVSIAPFYFSARPMSMGCDGQDGSAYANQRGSGSCAHYAALEWTENDVDRVVFMSPVHPALSTLDTAGYMYFLSWKRYRPSGSSGDMIECGGG